MNTVAATSAPAVQAPAARQNNVKGNTGEFTEMLSGAIKSNQANAKTEAVQTEKPVEETPAVQKGQKAEKPADAEKPVEQPDAPKSDQAETDEAAASAAAAQIAAQQPQQGAESTETDAETMTAIPAQAPRIQKVYAQVAETTAQDMPEVKAEQPQTDTAAQQTQQQQTVHTNQNTPRAATDAAEASGTVVQPGETKPVNDKNRVQAETQQVAAKDITGTDTAARKTVTPIKAEAQTDRAPIETADVKITGESAETVRQAAPETTQKPETETAGTQAKFDAMLAKASQELSQGKAATTVQGTTADETSVDANTETNEVPVKEAKTAEAPTKTESTPVKAEHAQKPETAQKAETANHTETAKHAKAAVQNTAETPRTEQPPLKETPKTDELTMGLVQPKEADIPQAETVRATQQAPMANPVKVPEQAEQIRTEVIRSMENEKMEFNMQLKPQELGKIDVKMVLESGKLAVEIVAANSKSTELLTRQVEALVASLKAGNIDVSSVNVVTASQSASGSMDGAYNLNNFENQNGAQQGGHTGKTGSRGQNGGNDADPDAQQEPETKQGPQRILNYSV